MFNYKECKYEWDPEKNKINIIKHKVSFPEAKTAFYDDNIIVWKDLQHSTHSEDRLYAIGMSKWSNLLFVCHCIRNENTIRIISARRAGPDSIQLYEEEKYQ